MVEIEERLARLEERINNIDSKLERIERAIYGNGEGLVERMARLESKVESLNIKMKLIITVVGVTISLLPIIVELLAH